ncbi:hypothetical protein GCM10008985_15500 [Halococcus dombrowskii]|uniref:Small CPxCG-related zinc finger protein n=1 Tax=Halococcus dombrowskii TaxID=179637 RepID=A0AAV3SFY7_HALDO
MTTGKAKAIGDDGREQRTHTASQDEIEANYDLVDCSECGQQFNLGAQTYYGPRCPSCRTSLRSEVSER